MPDTTMMCIELAVALYCRHIVSAGLAAELAGLSYIEFAEHLSQLRIPLADYGADQLDQELDTIGERLAPMQG